MLVYERKGRVWTEARREPYTRKDAKITELITWQSPCCRDGCTAMAEVRTSMHGYETSKAFDAKHCLAHKLTLEEVTARWSAALKAGRQAAKSGVEDLL